LQTPPSEHGVTLTHLGYRKPPITTISTSPHVTGTNVVLVVLEVVVLVLLLVLVVRVVVTQPPALQASQQLGNAPTHALAPDREAHFANGFGLQMVGPFDRVRQQVTNPGLPHVERAAHRLTAPLHRLGRSPVVARASATRAAQAT
jgi:hypothetical protein